MKEQRDLWTDGLSVARMFAHQKELSKQFFDGEDDAESEVEETSHSTRKLGHTNDLLDYGGGKWGRYLRAPDLYFEIMDEFGSKFVRIGDIALIKRGITSGCDAFFMPRDVSQKLLDKYRSEVEWKLLPLMRRCKRSEVESGKVKIIEAGDKTLHPIEAQFVRPEVQNLMKINSLEVRYEDLDRVALWVNKPIIGLKGTYVGDYLNWGSRQTFESKKSKAVPVPMRGTCVARELWYDITGENPGIGFWSKTHKYRHLIPLNPQGFPCDSALYSVNPISLDDTEKVTLAAILNSTLVGFFKHFYGRYAGAEGTLKTEVVDSLMMEIPSPIGVSANLSAKLEKALKKISKRDVTHLLEEKFRLCTDVAEMRVLEKSVLDLPLELQRSDRRDLDLLIFEMLGVSSPKRREDLVDQLYIETTRYYRALRIQDIQSTANRSKGGVTRISANSLAMGAWEEIDADMKTPILEWIESELSDSKTLELPDGEVRLPEISNMFEATTLYFGDKNPVDLILDSRIEAELLEKIASLGLRGRVMVPKNESDMKDLLAKLLIRLAKADELFTAASKQYASDEKLQGQVKSLMHKWFVFGKYNL